MSSTGLSATAISSSQINLSWTDNSNNEDGFRIERKTGSGGTYSLVATVGSNTTSYSNTGLSASTQYFFRVRAENSAGNSSWSNEANATTQAASGECTWTFAANEWGTVTTNGTQQVRFGANGNYLTQTVTGSIACSYIAFGGDPAPGVVKTCEICQGGLKNDEIISAITDVDVKHLQVFPNPLREGMLVVDFGNHAHGQLVISDIQGKVVYIKDIAGDQSINISHSLFNKGVYFVRFQSNSNVQVQRFLVQ